MKIIVNKILPPSGFKALTIGPFIFIKKDSTLSGEDINHEAIHWEQYKETLIIGFFLIYGLEFIIKFCIPSLTKNFSKPGRSYFKRVYRSLSLEQEAYTNEENSDYINHRKHYAWIKYLL